MIWKIQSKKPKSIKVKVGVDFLTNSPKYRTYAVGRLQDNIDVNHKTDTIDDSLVYDVLSKMPRVNLMYSKPMRYDEVKVKVGVDFATNNPKYRTYVVGRLQY